MVTYVLTIPQEGKHQEISEETYEGLSMYDKHFYSAKKYVGEVDPDAPKEPAFDEGDSFSDTNIITSIEDDLLTEESTDIPNDDNSFGGFGGGDDGGAGASDNW